MLVMTQSEIIARAVEKAGGTRVVAEALGMKSAEGVRVWIVRGKVPDKHLVNLERLTGVPRQLLRPDLFAPA